MATIKQTFSLPACKINQKTLETICKFLDKRRIEMKNEEHEAKLDIEIKMKRKNLEFDSCEEFLLQDIPDDLKSISFDLRKYFDYDHRIEIDLGFETWNTSKVLVSGEKSLWVNGVVKELEEIFNERSTRNGLLHEKKTTIPIVLMLAILTGFAFSIAYSINDEVNIWSKFLDGDSNVPPGFIVGLSTGAIYWWFLQWLFPIVEFEGIGIQQKIRKGILIIFGMILVGLVTTMIYDQIQQ